MTVGNTPATSGQSEYKSNRPRLIYLSKVIQCHYQIAGEQGYLQDASATTMTMESRWNSLANTASTPLLWCFQWRFLYRCYWKTNFCKLSCMEAQHLEDYNTGSQMIGTAFVNDNPATRI